MAGPSDGTVTPQRPPPQKQPSSSSTSSPGLLCSASTSYKKKPGTLTLTKKALTWSPSTPGQAEELVINGSRLNSLFSSKEGGAKVMIRVGLLPPATTTTSGQEEHLNFTFTAASSAVSDRERFKDELAQLISRNRSSRDGADVASTNNKGKASNGTVTPSTKGGGGGGKGSSKEGTPAGGGAGEKGKAVDPTQDWRVKKRVLQNDPELRQLHKELVMGKHITEGDFWEGREDLLIAEAMAESQRKGRSAQMVDPRPETTSAGEISISVTPQMIHDIFEQYPVVQKAYSENVPPLSDTLFWTRYFRSKLFHRHRSSARTLGDAVKDDEIFDRYLEDDDDGLEPKNLEVRQVYRLLDLAATEEDHGETGNMRDWTMRAGAQRAALPLMRRFNEHSERLLDSALGKSSGRTMIDGGDASGRNLAAYEHDIVISDLEPATAPDRILLDLQGQERFMQGGSVASASATEGGSGEEDGGKGKKRKWTEEERKQVEGKVRREVAEWVDGGGTGLDGFEVDEAAMEETTRVLLNNIRTRYDQRHGAKHDPLPAPVMASLTSLHSATDEFLRHFWTAVLPPRPNDYSAAAGTATPEQKAAKAQRMLGYLDKTEERVRKVVELAVEEVGDGMGRKEVEDRVGEAVEGVLKAVLKARQYFAKRVGA